MTHRRLNIAVYLIIFVALVDQMSKWWIINRVMKDEIGPLKINSVLNIVLVENRGITFGLLNQVNHTWTPYFLLALAAVILFLLGRWLWRTHSTPVAIGLGLIMGGAIGNVIDRIRYGAVVDFLDFYIRLGPKEHHWPAFNVADSAIVAGVGLLLLDGLLKGR
ncbi:MAG: signal peptidase II [Bdellovibrionales bacterium]